MVRVEVRFKNGILYDLLWDRFGDTAKLLHKGQTGKASAIPVAAEVIGVYAGTLRNLLSLSQSPWVRENWHSKKLKLSIPAQKVCEFFSMEGQEVFPPEMYQKSFPKCISANISTPQFISLTEAASSGNVDDPKLLEGVIEAERNECLMELLKYLSPRQEKIIKMRFGLGGYQESTLEEVGQELGLVKETVRQIESRALRALRNGYYGVGKRETLRSLL